MPTFGRWYHNATDTAVPLQLRDYGAFLAIEVQVPSPIAALLTQQGQPVPAGQTGLAIIDTGATFIAVHEPLLTGLGLAPVGVVTMGTANGPTPSSIYPARLLFPETQWNFDSIQVVGSNLAGQAIDFGDGNGPRPIIALIGRSLLQYCVLVWNGQAAAWSISY